MSISERDKRVAVWVAEHRGAITEIAKMIKPPVSPQFVQMVLKGKRKSKDGMVERELKKRGAPVR